MEKILQITKTLRVVIIIAIFWLFMVKVYNIWIYLLLFAIALLIRYVEIKKGFVILDKRKVLFFIISAIILLIVYFVYMSFLNEF